MVMPNGLGLPSSIKNQDMAMGQTDLGRASTETLFSGDSWVWKIDISNYSEYPVYLVFSPWVFHGAHASQNYISQTNPSKNKDNLGMPEIKVLVKIV